MINLSNEDVAKRHLIGEDPDVFDNKECSSFGIFSDGAPETFEKQKVV
jgi:hypothetical protein